MKLTKVRITNFQCIQASTEFDIGDVTCLVGKNESGKTALLKALYCLNPINEEDGNFTVIADYPRRNVTAYQNAIDAGESPAEVVQATYTLESEEIDTLKELFGTEYPEDKLSKITLRKGYSNELIHNGSDISNIEFTDDNLSVNVDENTYYGLRTNSESALRYLTARVPKFRLILWVRFHKSMIRLLCMTPNTKHF